MGEKVYKIVSLDMPYIYCNVKEWFVLSSLSLKCALGENGCRISYEQTKNELRSLSAANVQGHQCEGFLNCPQESDAGISFPTRPRFSQGSPPDRPFFMNPVFVETIDNPPASENEDK